MNSNDVALKLVNVSKTFYIAENKQDTIREKVFNAFSKNSKKKIEAVKQINLEIKKGELFAIIGKNGSGKSTLLNIIMGVPPADRGSIIEINGKIMRLSLGMGFNPNLTARENIFVNGTILGLSVEELKEKVDEIIEFAELENFIDTPVRFFSAGMRARLGFSIAIQARTEIFLFDEFFGGVGDLVFKKKSNEVFEKSLLAGKTIVLVTHSIQLVKKHSTRAMLMDMGNPVMIGDPKAVIYKYKEITNTVNDKIY